MQNPNSSSVIVVYTAIPSQTVVVAARSVFRSASPTLLLQPGHIRSRAILFLLFNTAKEFEQGGEITLNCSQIR